MTNLTKRYYKIGEVVNIIGVPQTTLRFWEKKFTQLHPKRKIIGKKSYRQYIQRDIELLRVIYSLRYHGKMKIKDVGICLTNRKLV